MVIGMFTYPCYTAFLCCSFLLPFVASLRRCGEVVVFLLNAGPPDSCPRTPQLRRPRFSASRGPSPQSGGEGETAVPPWLALFQHEADSSSSSGAAASRLRYRLLRGNGPKEGWVSIRCKGKALLAEADHADLAPPEQSMPFPAIGLGKPNLGAASGWASWHGFKRTPA